MVRINPEITIYKLLNIFIFVDQNTQFVSHIFPFLASMVISPVNLAYEQERKICLPDF